MTKEEGIPVQNARGPLDFRILSAESRELTFRNADSHAAAHKAEIALAPEPIIKS